jgi:hypothetical protein
MIGRITRIRNHAFAAWAVCLGCWLTAAGATGATPWWLPSPEPGFEQRANQVLDAVFTLQGVTASQPLRADGGLDWAHRPASGDKEWAWMLNRHGFFLDLHHTAMQSGDPRYHAALRAHWMDWIARHPLPRRLSFSPAWRPLEAARRLMQVWIPLWFTLQHDPLWADDLAWQAAVRASLADHGHALRYYASFWGGNHLITEKTALLLLTVCFTDLPHAVAWQEHALAAVSRQILAQSYPDGSYRELSNHYQRVVLVNGRQLQRLLPHLPPSAAATWNPLASRLEAMWDYFIRSMRPDGHGPLNNAGDLEYNRGWAADMDQAFDRADWSPFLRYPTADSETKRGPPSPDLAASSVWFPWAGQLVMRSGLGPAADWARFDLGPHGTAHQHDDRLHLSVYSGGRPLLVDNGRFLYRPGPWYAYFRSPTAHNSVSGRDGTPAIPPPRAVRQPLPVSPRITASRVEATGSQALRAPLWRGQAPVIHTRTVTYVEPGRWRVVDAFVGSANQQVDIHWNFHPDVTPAEADSIVQRVSSPPHFSQSRASARPNPKSAAFTANNTT